eukprot:scaffold11713_cov105-Isochrysis_galbana.AAC.2
MRPTAEPGPPARGHGWSSTVFLRLAGVQGDVWHCARGAAAGAGAGTPAVARAAGVDGGRAVRSFDGTGTPRHRTPVDRLMWQWHALVANFSSAAAAGRKEAGKLAGW